MPVTIEVLFGQPQREVASLLRDRLTKCSAAYLVSGFMTVEGMEAIAPALHGNPSKLKTLIVGAGTFKAYEAFDRLIAVGVPPASLFVHLGHTRPTAKAAKTRFYRYHPMLHSKVYLLDMSDGSSSAFIGSHNLTGFALLGLNGEAGVLIEGPSNSQEFSALRNHITESESQSIPYSSGMKEAYSWWTTQFVDGLRLKVDDEPKDGEAQRTIVIMSASSETQLPKKDEIIYFEIPEALGKIQSLSAEVHIYVFTTLPATSNAGLANLQSARKALWCRTIGLEDQQGGVELRADWYLDDRHNPMLIRTPSPFRPTPALGMQQVRVIVRNDVFDSFKYLFHTKRAMWEPIFDKQATVQAPFDDQKLLRSFSLIPPEDKPFFLVRGLQAVEKAGSDAYKQALRETSPDSGNFILLSMRRHKLRRK